MKKLMAANWKMYKTVDQGVATARELCALLDGRLTEDREVILFAPFTMLGPVAEICAPQPYCTVGAQNFILLRKEPLPEKSVRNSSCTWDVHLPWSAIRNAVIFWVKMTTCVREKLLLAWTLA